MAQLGGEGWSVRAPDVEEEVSQAPTWDASHCQCLQDLGSLGTQGCPGLCTKCWWCWVPPGLPAREENRTSPTRNWLAESVCQLWGADCRQCCCAAVKASSQTQRCSGSHVSAPSHLGCVHATIRAPSVCLQQVCAACHPLGLLPHFF